MKAVHVELPYEGRHIGMLEVLSENSQPSIVECDPGHTYESTLEKSWVGDMTKLSLLLDHDMRLEMLLSSSIL